MEYPRAAKRATAAKAQNITPDQKSFGARIVMLHTFCAARQDQIGGRLLRQCRACGAASQSGSPSPRHLDCSPAAAFHGNGTGEKGSRIHQTARPVDRRATTASRG